MRVGRSGIAAEVPDLAVFVAESTKSSMPSIAFYVEILDDDDEPIACLIFYNPQGGVIHFGAGLHKGDWDGAALNQFVWLHNLILWIAFCGLKFNHLRALIRPERAKVRRLLEMAGFNYTGCLHFQGGECLQYTLGDCV